MPILYLPVNSRTLPQDSNTANQTTTSSWSALSASIGDLDGNALRLLHVLVRLNYLSPISPEDWGTILTLYDKGKEVSAEDFERFFAILEKSSVPRTDTAIANSPALLRLIGDTLCDLGKDEDPNSPGNTCGNDGFTLLIYEFMHNNNIPFEILASNHDMEFLTFYAKYRRSENNLRNTAIRPSGKNFSALNFFVQTGKFGHFQYSCNMSDEQLNAIMEIYLKHLKIFSYEKTEGRLDLYAHALASIDNIEYAADVIEINLNPSEFDFVSGFTHGIDTINKRFIDEICAAIEKGDLGDVYDGDVPLDTTQKNKPKPMQTILAYATCKRGVSLEEEESNVKFENKAKVALRINHGHEKDPHKNNPNFPHRVPRRYHNLEGWKNNPGDRKSPTIELLEEPAIVSFVPTQAGAWCFITVAAAAVPVGVYAAAGATLLAALTAAWPIMVAIVVGSIVLACCMHQHGIFEVISQRMKNVPNSSDANGIELRQ